MGDCIDVVIIGGGPAGLAAALGAKRKGASVLVIEREEVLGGILNQCIHNGFGLHTFHEELTGPEYASRYIEQVKEAGINYLLHTMVVDISAKEKTITAMNREKGIFFIEAKAIVLAMGCRERPRGALNIPGYRPQGVYAAGTAQRYINIEGRLLGKEVVILGSGDIGLIMARRMTLEGAKVKLVAEIMPYSGGLKRNIVQCLEDYNIPLKLSHTVAWIDGKEQLKGVMVAKVDENRKPIPGTEEYIPCDTLLLSCGLIPENELSKGMGVRINEITSGPVVDDTLETNVEGVFACGNVLHVHDLVDFVSKEAEVAGIHAAAYATAFSDEMQERKKNPIAIKASGGVRYTVPSIFYMESMEKEQVVRFRVGKEYRDVFLVVTVNGRALIRQKKRRMAPGEMEQFVLKREWVEESFLELADTEAVVEAFIEEEGKTK